VLLSTAGAQFMLPCSASIDLLYNRRIITAEHGNLLHNEVGKEISIADAGLDRFSHAYNGFKRTGMDWVRNYV
jgi:hypothetical protein